MMVVFVRGCVKRISKERNGPSRLLPEKPAAGGVGTYFSSITPFINYLPRLKHNLRRFMLGRFSTAGFPGFDADFQPKNLKQVQNALKLWIALA